MIARSYRNPTCVEAIIRAVAYLYAVPEDSSQMGRENKARAMLAEGVEVDWICRSSRNQGIDPCPILLAALQSGDFTTVPRIDDRVRSVKWRRAEPRGPTGVNLFTDSDIIRGDSRLLCLLPPSNTPKSALVNILRLHPEITRKKAQNALPEYGFALGDYAFGQIWPECREAAELDRNSRPGPRGPRTPRKMV